MVGRNLKFAAAQKPKTKLQLLLEDNKRLRARCERLEKEAYEMRWSLQNVSEERERQSHSDWDRMGR